MVKVCLQIEKIFMEIRISTPGRNLSMGKQKKCFILSFKKGKSDGEEKFVYVKNTIRDKSSENL